VTYWPFSYVILPRSCQVARTTAEPTIRNIFDIMRLFACEAKSLMSQYQKHFLTRSCHVYNRCPKEEDDDDNGVSLNTVSEAEF